jgi:hypothetical protein
MSGAPSFDCSRECAQALEAEHFDEVGPGRMTAREAAADFAIRERTARAAGIDTCGISETLDALQRVPGNQEVLLFHFSGLRRIFTVFLHTNGVVFGCIRVKRRPEPPHDRQ